MRIRLYFLSILCTALCCVSSAAGLIDVIGYEDGDVQVPCRYDPGYEDYEKYLCRNDCRDNLIKTNQGNKTKYSISDDKKTRIFTATISDLRPEDAGRYWCGVRRTYIKDIYTEVNLEIKPAALCCVSSAAGSIDVFGYEDGDVQVPCRYDPGYEDYEKYLCRNDCGDNSDVLIRTSEGNKSKYSIYDNKKTRIVTVTISDLRSEDAGRYWCGVTRTGKDIYTEVKLHVVPDRPQTTTMSTRPEPSLSVRDRPQTTTMSTRPEPSPSVRGWCCVESKNMSGIVGRPVTLQCPYPPQHQNNSKFLCKGDKHNTCTDMMSQSRFTLHNVSSSSFWVTITELEAGDAGTYWCGSDSQWGAHNYTNIHLAADFPVETGTLTPNIRTEPNITDHHVKDETRSTVLVYVLPAVLILLLIFVVFLVMVLKNKCNRFQDV